MIDSGQGEESQWRGETLHSVPDDMGTSSDCGLLPRGSNQSLQQPLHPASPADECSGSRWLAPWLHPESSCSPSFATLQAQRDS